MFGRVNPPGLVYTIDLSKIADRENPRTVEAPIKGYYTEDIVVDWGDGSTSTFVKSGSGQNNGAIYPEHTYTDGTGDIFTVVIRSINGQLPLIGFNNVPGSTTEPTQNITYAVVSVEHYGGVCPAIVSRGSMFKRTYNLQYTDTRLLGEPGMSNAPFVMFRSGVTQSIKSMCFDFCSRLADFGSAFLGCSGLSDEIPTTFLDNCPNITTLGSVFNGCSGLTGAPYVFWNEDGSINSDKFPSLREGTYCYTGCSAALRAQVPTAYGGTMTVS